MHVNSIFIDVLFSWPPFFHWNRHFQSWEDWNVEWETSATLSDRPICDDPDDPPWPSRSSSESNCSSASEFSMGKKEKNFRKTLKHPRYSTIANGMLSSQALALSPDIRMLRMTHSTANQLRDLKFWHRMTLPGSSGACKAISESAHRAAMFQSHICKISVFSKCSFRYKPTHPTLHSWHVEYLGKNGTLGRMLCMLLCMQTSGVISTRIHRSLSSQGLKKSLDLPLISWRCCVAQVC